MSFQEPADFPGHTLFSSSEVLGEFAKAHEFLLAPLFDHCQTIHLYMLGLVRTRLPEKRYIPNSTDVIGIHLLEITELPSFGLRARERAPLVLMKCKQFLAKCASSALVSGSTPRLATDRKRHGVAHSLVRKVVQVRKP